MAGSIARGETGFPSVEKIPSFRRILIRDTGRPWFESLVRILGSYRRFESLHRNLTHTESLALFIQPKSEAKDIQCKNSTECAIFD